MRSNISTWRVAFALLAGAGCSAGAGDQGAGEPALQTQTVGTVEDNLGQPTADVAFRSLRAKERPNYLALGDSVAFGENGFVSSTDPARDGATAFVGYPELVALAPRVGALENLACPGESTGSFLSATAPDHGCREYKALHPLGLHVQYPGETQLQGALDLLAKRPETRLVTLNLGGNDLLMLLDACASAPDLASCASAALPATIAQSATNMATIMGAIRASGYAGATVFLTQYATNYNDPLQAAALPPLNQAVAGVAMQFGAAIADGYAAFQKASQRSAGDPCAAGLLIPSPNGDGTCDVHPSRFGQAMLATTTLRALGLERTSTATAQLTGPKTLLPVSARLHQASEKRRE